MNTYTVTDNIGTLATRADKALVHKILWKTDPAVVTITNNDNPDKPMNGVEWAKDNTWWTVEYDNEDVEDSLTEWWTVTDGTRTFKADTEADAEWLASALLTYSRL